MKRSGFKRKRKKVVSKSEKNKEFSDRYGINVSYWRYNGLKGVYWNLLSKYVRLRDFKKFGTCISCGKEFSGWTESQAGHYAPAKDCGFILLFDTRNVNGECAGCNNPYISPGKLIKYRLNLVKRYGEEYVAEIDEIYSRKHRETTKAWTQKEYDIKIRELQEKIKELENEDSKETTKAS